MLTLTLVHQTFGPQGGAEAFIENSVPMLQKHFLLNSLYDLSSRTDGSWQWDRLFPHQKALDFSACKTELYRTCLEALKRDKTDVIYLHNCQSVPILQALIDSKIPVVRMVHDHEMYCLRAYRYSPWTRRICKRKAGMACLFPCLAFAQAKRHPKGLSIEWKSLSLKQREIALNHRFSKLLVGSRYMKEELLTQGFSSDKIAVTPPVPPIFDTNVSASLSDRNRVVFAGQLLRGKGIDSLLRALAMCKQAFEAIIMGEGSHREYCENLTQELGLSQRVRFTGHLSMEQMLDVYREGSVGVVPSLWPEPFGIVGLEMMRCGLPIVAYDSGGIGDWLKDGETGKLIPWKREDLMAQAIDTFLWNKDLAQQYGQKARRVAQTDFDYHHSQMAIVELLKESCLG